MLVSSSSFVNFFSMLPSQSHQAWNFSTIHAASPAGESFEPVAERLRLGPLNLLIRALVLHVRVARLHPLQLRRRHAGVRDRRPAGGGDAEIQVQARDVRRVVDAPRGG